MRKKKKIFPKFTLGKHRRSKLYYAYTMISGYLMLALAWWYIAFPEHRSLSLTFLIMWIIATIAWFGHFFETLKIPVVSGAILPPVNYKQLKEIFIVSIASMIGIVYFLPKYLPDLPTLSSIDIYLISPIYVLIIWGWIIPFTEEKLFGGTLHPTIIENIYDLKFSRSTSIILGTIVVSGVFALFNQYVFTIPITTLIYYFIIRMFFSIVNLYYGSMLFGVFTHIGINSYLVCMLFNLPLLTCALPLGITMLMFYYLPTRTRTHRY